MGPQAYYSLLWGNKLGLYFQHFILFIICESYSRLGIYRTGPWGVSGLNLQLGIVNSYQVKSAFKLTTKIYLEFKISCVY